MSLPEFLAPGPRAAEKSRAQASSKDRTSRPDAPRDDRAKSERGFDSYVSERPAKQAAPAAAQKPSTPSQSEAVRSKLPNMDAVAVPTEESEGTVPAAFSVDVPVDPTADPAIEIAGQTVEQRPEAPPLEVLPTEVAASEVPDEVVVQVPDAEAPTADIAKPAAPVSGVEVNTQTQTNAGQTLPGVESAGSEGAAVRADATAVPPTAAAAPAAEVVAMRETGRIARAPMAQSAESRAASGEASSQDRGQAPATPPAAPIAVAHASDNSRVVAAPAAPQPNAGLADATVAEETPRQERAAARAADVPAATPEARTPWTAPAPTTQPAAAAASASAAFADTGMSVDTGGRWRLSADVAQIGASLDRGLSTPAAAALQNMPPQQVAMQITRAVDTAQRDRIEIRLDPPELGRVQIQLTAVDGGLQASVLAERQETQEFLRRHAEQLARDLNEAGYENVSLDFATGGEAQSGNDDPEAQTHVAQGAGQSGPGASPTGPAPSARVAAGGLDIRL